MSEEAIDEYMRKLRRKSESTKELKRYALERLDDYTNNHLDQLDRDDIEDFIEYLQSEGMKKTSINQYLSAVRSYYDYRQDNIDPGVGEEELRKNLSKRQRFNRITKVPNLKTSGRTKSPIPKSEVERIIKEARGKVDYHYRLITLLALFGLRKNELLSLKSEYVDLSDMMIYIPEKISKTQSSARKIPIPSVGADLLNTAGKYVLGRNGSSSNPYSQSFPNRVLSKYENDRTGHIYPHRFRITFNTFMVEAGVDDFIIKKLMGHNVEKDMTEYYRGESETLFEDMREAMESKNYVTDILERI